MVKYIADLLKTNQEECDRLELEWHSYSSTLSPIRACPPEILSMIFLLYLAENPRRVRQLLLVCRQWHEVTIKDPRMWNRIHITVKESEWDLKSAAKTYENHAKMCLQRSGSSLLDIELDCTELCSSSDQMLEMIGRSFAGQLADRDALDTFDNWLYALELDELEIPAITATCQPRHVVSAIKLIAGKNGENMSRCGSFRLMLPRFDDPELIKSILKLLKGPAPCLTRLKFMTLGLDDSYDDALAGCFSDLQSLKHLDVDRIRFFQSLKFNPSSIESLVMYDEDGVWSAYNLSQFPNLQYLELNINFPHSLEEKIEVSLPRLRQLTINSMISYLSEIQFHTPYLQDVNIRRRSERSVNKPRYLPGLQSLRVRWEGDYWGSGSDEQLQTEMEMILVHFHKAKQLTVSSCAKHSLIEALHDLHNYGELSNDLETVGFATPGGAIETIDVRALLMPNSS
jgi:hypothetical protein